MLDVEVVTDVTRLESCEPEWASLLERSNENEPTLSPDWLLTWWRVFGEQDGRQLRVAMFRDGGRLVGMAPLQARSHRDRLLVGRRRLELLASGEDQRDEICSEFIGVVAKQGAEEAVAEQVAAVVCDGALGTWDELSLPAMRGDTALPMLLARKLRERGLVVRAELTTGAPYVPLPVTWEEYLERLPSSPRALLRQSLRDFNRWAGGQEIYHRASTPDELEEGKRVLRALHEKRWTADGQPGVFRSKPFCAFHDAIMARLLAAGRLHLDWITLDGAPVAAAYNLVWNRKVYYYQGGRRPDLPAKVRAGLVLHAHAIKDAIAAGHREYHFLAGLTRYKMQLALALRPVVHVTAYPPSLRQIVSDMGAALAVPARAIRRYLAAAAAI
jgi:CelD/BcsL family acetyltransferase involved in cellulose biosynthesis